MQLQASRWRCRRRFPRYELGARRHGTETTYVYDPGARLGGIAALLDRCDDADIRLKDLHTTQSSLEDIFVSLVRE